MFLCFSSSESKRAALAAGTAVDVFALQRVNTQHVPDGWYLPARWEQCLDTLAFGLRCDLPAPSENVKQK